MRGFWIIFIFTYILFPEFSFSGRWVNPKEVVKDPLIVRLQQGRKELTPLEKEEINKYGYTGLELMTYVEDDEDQGQDNEMIHRQIEITPTGHMEISEWLAKIKYYYRDFSCLLTYNGIKPGDVEQKRLVFCLNPPNMRGTAFLPHMFLTSKDFNKRRDIYQWSSQLRKIRHITNPAKEDGWGKGSVITMDDGQDREPWEEDHKILGKDNLRGFGCFVVESVNGDPNYYLGKRVTWVEEKNFLDIHEEQFDKKGRLFKIFDKEWLQVKPWNYWVVKQWDVLQLGRKHRSIRQTYDWVFDQDLTDKDFQIVKLEEEFFSL